MSRISILTTLFGISVIILSLLSNIFFQSEDLLVPEVDPVVLEELSPAINQSFIEDLKERSNNSAGIELEL